MINGRSLFYNKKMRAWGWKRSQGPKDLQTTNKDLIQEENFKSKTRRVHFDIKDYIE